MEHILSEIIKIEAEAKQIVGAQAAHDDDNRDEINRITEAAEKAADTQIAEFSKQQQQYLETESAAIADKLRQNLSAMDAAFEQNKGAWVDALTAEALRRR